MCTCSSTSLIKLCPCRIISPTHGDLPRGADSCLGWSPWYIGYQHTVGIIGNRPSSALNYFLPRGLQEQGRKPWVWEAMRYANRRCHATTFAHPMRPTQIKWDAPMNTLPLQPRFVCRNSPLSWFTTLAATPTVSWQLNNKI